MLNQLDNVEDDLGYKGANAPALRRSLSYAKLNPMQNWHQTNNRTGTGPFQSVLVNLTGRLVCLVNRAGKGEERPVFRRLTSFRTNQFRSARNSAAVSAKRIVLDRNERHQCPARCAGADL
jgi:hypothetical protein